MGVHVQLEPAVGFMCVQNSGDRARRSASVSLFCHFSSARMSWRSRGLTCTSVYLARGCKPQMPGRLVVRALASGGRPMLGRTTVLLRKADRSPVLLAGAQGVDVHQPTVVMLGIDEHAQQGEAPAMVRFRAR